MNMTILDFIEAWWLSVQALLESGGVVCHFERSPDSRLNPSCSLNLRRNEIEADLLVWESGEVELSVMEADGTVKQQHFDDIRRQPDLGVVLSQLTALAQGTM
jgi:hypothetical protein